MHIDPAAYFFAAILILFVPFPWLSAAIVAAFFHEMAHIICILLLGGKITHIKISVGGTKIETCIGSLTKELICTLIGPFVSISTIFLSEIYPRLALCALIQGLFNLIPIYPLDGGRAVFCFLQMLIPKKADYLSSVISNLILYLFIIFSLFGLFFLSLGPIPLTVFLLFLYVRKKTCKEQKIGIQ